MNSGRNLDHVPGISLVDIYFVLFRRKWLILFFAVLGLVAGGGYYATKQPLYQSSALLMIKYVSDTRVSPGENGSQLTSTTDLNANLMNSEIQILSSFDLYQSVATNVGPEKILAKSGGGNDALSAAEVVRGGVRIEPLRESSVIQITFSHKDQTIVKPVLAAVIDAYREKHMQVHKAYGISDDFLVEKRSDMQQQITDIDNELRMVKTNAGVIDVKEADKSYSDLIAQIRQKLLQAEAELTERQALMAPMATNRQTTVSATSPEMASPAPESKIPADTRARYKAVSSRLVFLNNRQTDYLTVQGYTEENRLVNENRQQIAEAQKIKKTLEQEYPALVGVDAQPPASSGNNSAPDNTASLQGVSLTVRISTLQAQLAQLQAEAVKLSDAETKIAELERRKKLKESYLESFTSTLDRKQIDEALGPGQLFSNLPEIQLPTPPFRDFKKFYKNIGMLVFGSIFAGLALAFLLEMYLDRTIKRPIEVQTKLKIPFFLSIPDLGQGGKRSAVADRKMLGNAGGSPMPENGVAVRESQLEVMSWQVNRRFDSYYDALRDRLVVYFESINLTRKPKLVAVTSTHSGAGVSTIAAGLASSLSETGDGRVLLVDMNLENGAAQQFFKGKAHCKLDDALESETRDGARVQDNLYVVTEDTVTDRLPRALPKRFASLIPKLKASDYDYIIFDMPPVSPTSVTARLSGFMDTVMLVIESEKTDQQVVQQANSLLAQSKANVTAVLNKTKTYIPKQLHKDFLSET